MFKVIVAGSRTFNDSALMCRKLDRILANQTEVEIVSGTARGADKLGEQYAASRGYGVKLFPADWETHGKRAGFIRNEEMANYADACVVFWDSESRGTKSMIDLAEKHKLKLRIITYDII